MSPRVIKNKFLNNLTELGGTMKKYTDQNISEKIPVSFHCVKGVRIRSFSAPYVPAFGLYLSVFSPNAGKYGPEKLRIRIFFMQCLPPPNFTFMKDLDKPKLPFGNKGVASRSMLGEIFY